MMPRLDGFELLSAIRRDETLREIPVIMLSARAGEQSKIEGLSAGAEDYLVKPFSGRELLARISANLGLLRIRREAADRQRVLAAELQHRTRNILGVVRSIADRTIAQSNSLMEFRHAFQERLKALARVNGLLSRLNTRQRITFSELVRSELSGMGILDARDGRVRLTGPENIKLRSSTVQTLALGLHELATNALKYGALSRPDGRLSVSWTVQRTADEEQRLKVEWRESAVAIKREPDAKPTRVGYGRELIEQALPYQLKAETTYLITPDGVHCTIALPLSTAQEGVLDV